MVVLWRRRRDRYQLPRDKVSTQAALLVARNSPYLVPRMRQYVAAQEWPGTIDIREGVVIGGAPTDSRSCGGGDLRCGVVHVFERDEGGPDAWGETTVIHPPVPAGEGRFGGSVTIVAPDYFVATQVGPHPGAAYAFVRTEGGAWDTPVSFPPPDWPGENYDWGYGSTATSTSELVALGAYLADHACPGSPDCDSGAVYVFEAGAVNLIFADGFESGDVTR